MRTASSAAITPTDHGICGLVRTLTTASAPQTPSPRIVMPIPATAASANAPARLISSFMPPLPIDQRCVHGEVCGRRVFAGGLAKAWEKLADETQALHQPRMARVGPYGVEVRQPRQEDEGDVVALGGFVQRCEGQVRLPA